MKTFKQLIESLLVERADSLEDIQHKVDNGQVSKVMGKSGQNRHGPLLTSKGLAYAANTRENHPDAEVRAAFAAHHSNPEHPMHKQYLDRTYDGNKVGKGGRVSSSEPKEEQPKAAPVDPAIAHANAKERAEKTAAKMASIPKPATPITRKPTNPYSALAQKGAKNPDTEEPTKTTKTTGSKYDDAAKTTLQKLRNVKPK